MKKNLLVVLTSIFALLFTYKATAQNVTIPDANFKAALVGNGSINTNLDAEIQVSEAAAFTGTLDVQSQNIYDLTGISAFTGITALNCNFNQLSALNLSANTALTSLDCYQNKITSLNLSANTALTTINCGSNVLTSLTLPAGATLTSLDCSNNQLTNLNLATNTGLTIVSCNNNSLTAVVLPGAGTALNYFYGDHNQLTTLDASNQVNLIDLNCNDNQITGLNISGDVALANLNCYNNAITSLNLSGKPNLSQLYCYNNKITNLDLSSNTALAYFDCSSNKLVTLNMKSGNNGAIINFSASNNPNLECIQVDNAAYSTTNWTSISGTSSFSQSCPPAIVSTNVFCGAPNNGTAMVTATSAAPFTYSWSTAPVQTTQTATGLAAGDYTVTVTDALSAVSTATVTIYNVVNIPDATFKSNLVSNGSINTNGDGEIQCTEAAAYTGSINVYGWGITNMTGLEAFTSLTGLDCSSNTLASLNVSANTALTSLSCNSCSLTTLNLSSNTALASLSCSNNQITSLNLSANTALTDIDCNSNQISSLVVPAGATLTTLYCNSNKLAGLNTSAATGLTYINCQNNTLTNLNVSGNTALNTLLCDQNQLTNLNLSPNTALTSLGCAYNALVSLNVQNGNNTNFTNFVAYGNPALTCIQVDDASYSSGNWGNIDGGVGFSTACAPAILLHHVFCGAGNVGSATVFPSTGTAPYTYLWSTVPAQTTQTATGLAAGFYSVTVTDAGSITSTASGTITQIVKIPNADFKSIVVGNSSINTNADGEIQCSEAAAYTGYLDIDDYGIDDVTGLEAFTAITGFNCDYNNLTSLDLSANTALTEVRCTDNQLTSLNLSANAALVELHCDGNQLVNLNLSANPALNYLECSNNPLTGGLNLSANTALKQLYCQSDQLTNLNLSANTALTEVHCSSNLLTTLDITNNISLGYLDCQANQLTSLNLKNAHNFNLGSLSAYSNSSLTCIQVDDASAAYANSNWYKDPTTGYSSNCLCFGFAVSSAVSQPACTVADGSITANVTGGVSPFTYSWNNGATTSVISNVAAGNYSISVTDNVGCVFKKQINLSNSGEFGAGVTTTNISCNGANNGIMNGMAFGGNGPYTFLWTPGGQTTQNISGLSAGLNVFQVTDNTGCVALASDTVIDPAPLAVTVIGSDPYCVGSSGHADANVSGGTTPYTYAWSSGSNSPQAYGLYAGTYTLTVTDKNGCSKVDSVKIVDPIISIASTSQTNVTCFGLCNGTAHVNAAGAGPMYHYYWSTSPVQMTATATGLCPGDYTVTVTDSKDCTPQSATATFTITEPTLLTASAGSNKTICSGNSVTIGGNTTGGTAPLTYLWSPSAGLNSAASAFPSASPVVPTNYTLTVTDANGCTSESGMSMGVNASPTVSITASTNALCFGGAGSATATAGGGTGGLAYAWAPSGGAAATASGLSAGNYTVSVTDTKACVKSATVAITQPAAVTSTITASANVSCNGANNGSATVTASGGTGAYTYLWTPGALATSSVTGLAAAVYTVSVKDANNCVAASRTTSITQPTALSVTVSSTNITCNALCNGSASAAVSGGTTPYSFSWNSGQTTSAVNALCANSYSVSVTDNKGCVALKTVSITQPAVLSVSVAIANVSCNNACDGSLISTPSGGTGPYTYSWMPGGNTTPAMGSLCANSYTLTLSDAHGCNIVKSASITEPAALTTTLTQTNATCSGACTGSASVVAAGGIGPYTYMWIPSGNTTPVASLVCPGRQSLVVTDSHNCVKVDTITVGQPLPVPITVTTTPTSCGVLIGSASASVSGPGAVPPFSFLWSTGKTTASINGLDAAIYSANVTDGNGCFGFAEGFVYSSNGPAVTNVVTDVSCHGLSNGAINITVIGGAPPYKFLWSTGATTEDVSGLSYGPYEVKVKDASGCLVVKSIFVNEPAALVLSSSSISSGCAAMNGSASVMVSGGTSPYSYLWNAGGQSTSARTNIGAGIYVVHATDSKGCSDSTLIAVQDSSGPVVFVDTIVAANCGSSGYILLVPQDSNTIAGYNWTTGSIQQNLTGVTPGNYGVVITDTSGCKSVLITPVKPVLPPVKPICLVTVDTLTQQNIIVWEKPISSFISGFNIYRESSKQGIYQKIAFSPYSHVSTYYDSIPDASAKWARYRISMTDICGAEGPLSPDHKTIHLSTQFMNNDSTSLIWDPYVGYAFAYYHILRKDSSNGAWVLLDSVPASQTSYLDKAVPHTGDTIFYHVDVAHSGGDCVASIKYPEVNATSVKSSKSNSSDRMTIHPDVAVSETVDFSSMNVYPNPSIGMFSVTSNKHTIINISLYNTLGEQVYIQTVNAKKYEVYLPSIANGIYQMKITTASGTVNKKIIISR